jgi:hypothetical protein
MATPFHCPLGPYLFLAELLVTMNPSLPPPPGTMSQPKARFLLADREGKACGNKYLRWVRKLPLAWPEPSQPGVGQVGPSFFSDFQEKDEPLREPSFCLRAARGQPDALL